MKAVKLVTGTGSSGTTFFIQFLARLGLTQAFGAYNEDAKGGYEWVFNDNAEQKIRHTPPIFKDPRAFFGDLGHISERLATVEKQIDFVWICYRNFDQASASRIKRGVFFARHKGLYGVGDDDHAKQVDFFRRGLDATVAYLCQNDISFMLVDYERLGDVEYCAQCLRFAGYNLPKTVD